MADNEPPNQDQTQQNRNASAKKNNNNSARRKDNNNRNRNNPRGPSGPNQRKEVKHNTRVDMKKYEKMMNAAHDNFSDIHCGRPTEECVICCKPNDVFGVGLCRHPVCAECAIRMRVLGGNKGCPVCRTDIEILSLCTVAEDLTRIPLPCPKTAHPDEDRFGIRFSNAISGSKYEKYLSHVCKLCKSDDGERLEFPSFISLRQHMANAHHLSYCSICTENLNLFSRERKTYTRDTLTRHTRIGDPEDRSFKGHPQCLFCEQKFFDNETRYRHLRKDHFFCQFCEQDGTMTNVFFGKHAELLSHYKEKHYPCESDECKALGIAYASKLELELHRAEKHLEKRNLLDLGFVGRGGVSLGASGGGGHSRGRGREEAPAVPRERIAMVPQQQTNNPQTNPSQFTVVPSAQSRNPIRYARGPAYTPQAQDFPSLGPMAAPAPPPPPMRSNDFPRLNRVNRNGPTAEANKTPVEQFPSLVGSSPRPMAPPVRPLTVPSFPKKQPQQPQQQQHKQQQQEKAIANHHKHTERFDVFDDDDERVAAASSSSALIRQGPPPSLAPPPSSNVQLVSRIRQTPQAPQAAAPRMAALDFPALPASTPSVANNSIWATKNKSIGKGVITGVSVPKNYQNNKKQQQKKLPVPDVWPQPGAQATTPEPPKEEEWQDVPSTKPPKVQHKTKKEKKEEREKLAAEEAKKAERSKTQSSQESLAKPSSMADIGAMISRSEVSTVEPAEEEWQEVSTGRKNVEFVANGEKKKNKKKKAAKIENKESESSEYDRADEVPVAEANVVPEEKQSVSESTSNDSLKQAIGAFFNIPMPSLSSMFSGLSLSNSANNAPSPNASVPPGLLSPLGPPPGLEGVILAPPPGLSLAPKSEPTSFADAPFLSHSDLQNKRDMLNLEKEQKKKVAEDGWTTTATQKKKK